MCTLTESGWAVVASEEYTRVVSCDAYYTSEKERDSEVEGERGREREREREKEGEGGRERGGKGGRKRGEKERERERERKRERTVLYLNVHFIYVACIVQLINIDTHIR